MSANRNQKIDYGMPRPKINCYIFYSPSNSCIYDTIVERSCVPQSVGDKKLLGTIYTRAWVLKDDTWQEVKPSWTYCTGLIKKMILKDQFVKEYFELLL